MNTDQNELFRDPITKLLLLILALGVWLGPIKRERLTASSSLVDERTCKALEQIQVELMSLDQLEKVAFQIDGVSSELKMISITLDSIKNSLPRN